MTKPLLSVDHPVYIIIFGIEGTLVFLWFITAQHMELLSGSTQGRYNTLGRQPGCCSAVVLQNLFMGPVVAQSWLDSLNRTARWHFASHNNRPVSEATSDSPELVLRLIITFWSILFFSGSERIARCTVAALITWAFFFKLRVFVKVTGGPPLWRRSPLHPPPPGAPGHTNTQRLNTSYSDFVGAKPIKSKYLSKRHWLSQRALRAWGWA